MTAPDTAVPEVVWLWRDHLSLWCGTSDKRGMRIGSTPYVPQAALLAAEARAEKVLAALTDACDRMERARGILTDNNPRPECNWGDAGHGSRPHPDRRYRGRENVSMPQLVTRCPHCHAPERMYYGSQGDPRNDPPMGEEWCHCPPAPLAPSDAAEIAAGKGVSREPTDAMLEVGYNACDDYIDTQGGEVSALTDGQWTDMLKVAWTRMYDAHQSPAALPGSPGASEDAK